MTKGVLLFEIKKKKYHVIEGSLQIKSMIYLNSLYGGYTIMFIGNWLMGLGWVFVRTLFCVVMSFIQTIKNNVTFTW